MNKEEETFEENFRTIKKIEDNWDFYQAFLLCMVKTDKRLQHRIAAHVAFYHEDFINNEPLIKAVNELYEMGKEGL